ncbi:hypothetical protein Dd1591_0915 [Dickeya chrysanthemi Ech1591]|uniref:Lipoprotein n=1 Tax=Dickeya chrysanthemi (strain Ech1591) TaxID=561229 RepID=C6CMM0_DICC1|nr:hypothetical protein [Dickeya chrysanthemi]ACT05794.1 hypothetical protein Dd1591_0915 [Dickeya chrysanthemi Ech1591]WJM84749.1 hypothetical protein QUF31_16710 [Dickeya chrysanthemi]
MFIRIITLCFVTLVLSACVTGERFSKISQGMSRAEVIDRLGRPDGVQTQGTTELLTYANRFMSDWSWDKADYQVLLNNGIVVQYGAANIYRDTGAAARMMAAGQIMQQNKPVQTSCNQFGTSVYCSSY